MQEFVLSLVLATHLLTMNVACAGPMYCVWLRWRRAGENSENGLANRVGRSLAWLSLIAFVSGMLIGGVWWWVGASPGLTAALDRFPSRAYWMAATELLFSLVCLFLYAVCWRALAKYRWLHAMVALLSTTNLFHHFPPLMEVIGKLASDPNWVLDDVIDRSTFLDLMLRSEILALTFHFVLASIAVAGIAVLWMLARQHGALETSAGQHLARRAAQMALIVSLFQLPIGAWLVISLPNHARGALMGKEPIASLLFLVGLVITMRLLQRLVGLALGESNRQSIQAVGWLTVVLVVLMTATLRSSRSQIASDRPADASTNFGGQRTTVEEIASSVRPQRF